MTFSEELIDLLKKELKILLALKESTFEKTDLIIENQVEKLEEMLKKEEELINTMAITEEKRIKLLDSWGVDTNTPLSELIKNIPEKKENLIDIGEKLSKSLEEIQSRNDINNQLINENLQWLDFNMNLLTNTQTPTTYGKEKKGKETKNNLFDRKV
ncbi:flagellar protein FlgN [Schnuerera sp.]|uniref:flagellar protein FlgN n=1 Tax=Schnuerera sp. TaxID=2794844 RepID=UPI002CC30274|nr:flagellar protein FlgN [Schnuerera sp.]HSH37046.1 flagellar protein FlgN [Schnuerera sp.]